MYAIRSYYAVLGRHRTADAPAPRGFGRTAAVFDLLIQPVECRVEILEQRVDLGAGFRLGGIRLLALPKQVRDGVQKAESSARNNFV